MAKYRPRHDFGEFDGDFAGVRYTGVEKGGLDVLLTRNQHALIYCRKPYATKKRTKIQDLMRDRFEQLECMWQAMTIRQRELMNEYAAEQNEKDRRNLSSIQRFRSLGLDWELYRFIQNKLNPDYKLKLIEKTEDQLTFLVELFPTTMDYWKTSPLRNVH